MTDKNPRSHIGPLVAEPSDHRGYTGGLWRIYRNTGPYRQQWQGLRDYGPLRSARWDPHPDAPGDHPDAAVGYAATDVTTAFAEVFQDRRALTLSSSRTLAFWQPARPLRLLDLTEPSDPDATPWATRNGASGSLLSAPKNTCRAWARAIRMTWPDLDGLYVPSTMTLHPMVVLYRPAADSFPDAPLFARAIAHPALAGTILEVAARLGWPVRTLP